MALSSLSFIFAAILALASPISSSPSLTVAARKPYIIHMDAAAKPAQFNTHESWYLSALAALPAGDADAAHLYTYTHAAHGFSAALTGLQLEQLRRADGFLAAFPDSFARLHTSHTPEFLGLGEGSYLEAASDYGSDIVIGVVDTGIWPESASFADQGLPPVPAKWRGRCESGQGFTTGNCNRKLVGARAFSKGLKHHGMGIDKDDYDSPRDFFGHGSHTASTAAGRPVPGASYFGYANGTATGMAPKARLAVYKAVFQGDDQVSASSDVLAAIDQAIADGVGVLSLSLGFSDAEYYTNVIAKAGFAAAEKGVLVVASAGNSGPDGYTILNGAPWMMAVGASTVDREFTATITLGDGRRIEGRSIYPKRTKIAGVKLYYGKSNRSKATCELFSLSKSEVKGKIVFCESGGGTGDDASSEQILEIRRSGARGMIVAARVQVSIQPSEFVMPIVEVSVADSEVIKSAAAAPQPVITIRFTETALGRRPAPQVAYFSSRGPSPSSPSILKPDVIAPGVDILAAWVPNKEIITIGGAKLFTNYSLVSGTSMSCPHVAGIAALLRSLHKDWSPAAVRSALMTTAYTADNANGTIIDMERGSPATPLDFGSGHIDPNRAADPGLVYDSGVDDYIGFLCSLNYTDSQVRVITRRRGNVCATVKNSSGGDLNYPSFMVILDNGATSAAKTFNRELTSMEESPTEYRAEVSVPAGMEVTVTPATLSFDGNRSKRRFQVRVVIGLKNRRQRKTGEFIGASGWLNWREVGGKQRVVKSPIVAAFAL